MQTRAFWKGEVGIQGQVKDREKLYDVRLEVKGSYVNSYSCSCTQGNLYKEMCPHEKALLEWYKKQASSQPDRPVSTSSQVRAMIREYTNREVAQILQEHQEEPVRLVPRIIISRQGIQAEFKLGRERLYVIKDLVAFARAMEQGTQVEYGKNLSFYHGKAAFAPECQDLLLLVLELMGSLKEHYEQFQKNPYSSVPAIREMNISQTNRDKFLGLFAGREVEIQDGRGVKRQIRVVRENPETMITVRRRGLRRR